MIPLHLGALHAYEQGLTLLLAFGPFAVLGVVVWLRRRADAREGSAVRQEDPGPLESPSVTARGD
jgi:hypothetical protein